MRNIIIVIATTFICGNAIAFTIPFSTSPAPAQAYATIGANTNPDTSSRTTLINSAGVDIGSGGQVSQLTQSTMAYERHTDHRLQNLTNSNHAISIAIQTIEQNITQLQQQIAMLAPTNSVHSFSSAHNQTGNSIAFYLNLAAAGLFLLLSGLMIGKLMSRRVSIPVSKQSHVNTDNNGSDYDFMRTAEAIPAQLDLARSYIAMRDYDQARTVLRMVIEKGNTEQRLAALGLIETLK